MQLECHLAVGWLMGNLVPGAGRRFRALVAFSAMAPDLDGLSYICGPDAYAHCHHVYGHNVFAGAVFTVFCVAMARPGWRWMMLLLSSLGFASHWVGDYYFSGWPLMTFWPVSHAEAMYRPAITLDNPINMALSYTSLVFFVASVWIWKRSVFETVWPAMDRLLVGLTRPRHLLCAACGGRTAQRCHVCGEGVCLRHGRVTRRMTIVCGPCAAAVRERALVEQR